MDHYVKGKEVIQKRKTQPNGWDAVLRSYYGVLPAGWPYISKVTDPVIRTAIIEKTSRLFNGKLKGTLTPREGGDVIKAKIQNALLDFQWDMATEGGAMLEKWALMDMQTRLFGASFALCYWRVDPLTGFEGNEFKVLDNRDIIIDPSATHVKNANWVQVREFKTIKQLKDENDNYPIKGGLYKNLNKLIDLVEAQDEKNYAGDRRDDLQRSIIREVRGLEDPIGTDRSYPTIEVVTEYREDKWYTFCPRYSFMLCDKPNPRKDKAIPVVQLRYYPVGDDTYGEIEVASVLPIARAINATLSGFIDQMNLTMRPPIKVANNSSVRLDTIVHGPNALWLVGDSVNNVAEHASRGEHIANFQSSYSALKSAFNVAMGETSQGTSGVDPFTPDKTATEVRAIEQQKRSRDQYNQMYLAQALKDQMMLWLSSNKQFIFDDPTKHVYVQRVVGKDLMNEFQNLGLDQMEAPQEAYRKIEELVLSTGGAISDQEMKLILEGTQMPTHPVILNPNEKDPTKYDIRPKLEVDEAGKYANLNITPEDLEDGTYDYVPSVESMAIEASDMQVKGRTQALNTMLNPAVGQMLAQEGKKINIKEVLIQVLEDLKIKNADKLFEEVQGNPNQGSPATGGNPTAPGMELGGIQA